MKKILICGAGLVGGPMALDMAGDPDTTVTVADKCPASLRRLEGRTNLLTQQADLSDEKQLAHLAADKDLVISAVPGFMGFGTLRNLIRLKKNVVDIAFFPEDMLALDAMAREQGVTVISDMGVAPGMSHVLSGFASFQLDETDSVLIYVGGLPIKRIWPFEYRAVFSPADVLEEYTREARVVENGRVVAKPALSERELIHFERPGTLEAFNSDGLRSLTHTLKANRMAEKTLRYKGHAELMEIFSHTGFFATEPVQLQGHSIRPVDFTSKLLFPIWKLQPGEADLTVMRIEVTGIKNGQKASFTFDLYDEYDPATGIHSMARTTGYAATSAARLILEGLYTETGVTPPEFLGKRKEWVDFLLKQQAARGIHYQIRTEGL